MCGLFHRFHPASEQAVRVLAFTGAGHAVVTLDRAMKLVKDAEQGYDLVRYRSLPTGARFLERCKKFRRDAPFAHDLAGCVRETCFLVKRSKQGETEALLFGVPGETAEADTTAQGGDPPLSEEQLTVFYRMHAPEKVEGVHGVFDFYITNNGHADDPRPGEEELNEKLKEAYGVGLESVK